MIEGAKISLRKYWEWYMPPEAALENMTSWAGLIMSYMRNRLNNQENKYIRENLFCFITVKYFDTLEDRKMALVLADDSNTRQESGEDYFWAGRGWHETVPSRI